MANKYKRKGKSKFIMIEGYVKRSPAWKALTPIERSAYLEVKWRFDGMNNGRIGLGCRELADELGMSRNTADRALDRLAEIGFIAKAKPSAFNVKNRSVTEWRLTEYRCDVTGELPTKDFMRWEPKEKTQSHPRDTQSRGWDCCTKNKGQNTLHSVTHGTVGPVSEVSQSHPRDTYRYTIGGEAVTDIGIASQQLVASLKRKGWTKPADFPANQKAGEVKGGGANVYRTAKGGIQ
ncbi:MarR family transcriptional regulator [Brucella sp. 2280]|uniref:MarR family transcriptional regulator n=1 Tax=Brucella sp. 2280 TaxID=2592625 RepID=UPI001FFFBD36|nr:MarR family transcriptional regulator [Brucella sp. 2280]